jgi:ribosome maturation factor RimP
MDKAKIIYLVNLAIEENPELFWIELNFLPENKIYVEVDGDHGISLEECIRISRGVDQSLDREEEDFSLEVTSPDIAKPLKVKRQYIKNINRQLKVKLKDNSTILGNLKDVGEASIDLEWKTREPKPLGKGKVTVVKKATIQFDDILEAKVKLLF